MRNYQGLKNCVQYYKFIYVIIIGLAVILNQECQSACQYGFPHILGGPNGQTQIQGMDMRNDQIVIAGAVFDNQVSLLADNRGRPYIALIKKANKYLWSRVFDSPDNTFIMAKFSAEGDRVITMNDRAPHQIVILFVSDGEPSIYNKVNTKQIVPKIGFSTAYVDSSIYIVALTTTSNQFLVLSFLSTSVGIFKTTDLGFGASILRSGNRNLTYIGGMQKKNTPLYPCFTILDNSSKVLLNAYLNTSAAPNIEKYVSQMTSFPNFAPNIDIIVGTLIIDTGINSKMLIFKADVNQTSYKVGSSRLLTPSIQFVRCLHLSMKSPDLTAMIVTDSLNSQIYMEININSFNVETYKSAVVFYEPNYYATSAALSQAYGPIIAGYSAHIAGYSISSPFSVPFPQIVGYITAMQKPNRCNGNDYLTISSPTISLESNVFQELGYRIDNSGNNFFYDRVVPLAQPFNNPNYIVFNCTSLDYYQLTGFVNKEDTIYLGKQHQYKRQTPKSDCSGSKYSINVLLNDTLSDLGTVATSIMNYYDSNLTISYQNNDRSLDGKKVVIHIHAFLYQSWQQTSYTLTLNLVQDPCEKVVITPTVLNNVTYDLQSGNGVLLNYLNWTQTYKSECPISYSVNGIDNKDGSSYNLWYQISGIQLLSYNLNRQGVFTVTVDAYVLNNTLQGSQTSKAQQQFQLQVIGFCKQNKPLVPSTLKELYTINFQQRKFITIDPWELVDTNCNQKITYNVSGLPSFANIDYQTLTIEIYPSSSPAHIGNFSFEIIATIDVEQTIANVNIQVLQQLFPFTKPTETFQFEDYFMLQDQVVKAGQTLTQMIFKSTELQEKLLNNFNFVIDLDKAFVFSEYTNGKVIFSPPLNTKNTTYNIKIQVTSISTQLAYNSQYLLFVTLLEEPQQNYNSSLSLDLQFYKFQYINTTTQIKATMSTISRYGVFTLYFNDTLLVPQNSGIINTEKALKFQVRDGINDIVDFSKQNVTNFTVQKYNSKYIEIKLEFSNPKILSQQSVRQIVFKIIVIRQIGMHI
eukprot:403354540